MRSGERVMQREATLTAARLKAPRAAAVAGILFSILLIVSFVLLRLSVPADPLEAGAWLRTRTRTVALALNLIPFAGHRLLVVHRRPARPPGRARRPLLRDCLSGKRAAVPRHVVFLRSGGG